MPDAGLAEACASRSRCDPRGARAHRAARASHAGAHLPALDAVVGAKLFFKCENFQRIGAFKARGAVNAVFSLAERDAAKGVVTHSSGNHGAALAYAAARRGIRAFVVMPENAARIKQDNVRALGATIRFSAPNAVAREALCADVQRETGATLIHPFDNVDVIAGQGTAAIELLEDAPDLDVVIAPIGGGGLLSGTAIAAKGMRPGIRVFGAEPANADDASRGFRSGRVEPVSATTTIADGLRSPVSARTLGAIRANVEAIGTASEEAIVRAMRSDLGKDEDRHRAVGRRSARLPPRAHARRGRSPGRHHPLRRQRRSRPAAVAGVSAERQMKTPEIRCPSCRWKPDAGARWSCLPRCGTMWFTFATGGVCPGCGVRWHRTQCLKCGAVSPHRDWYLDPEDDTPPAERRKIDLPAAPRAAPPMRIVISEFMDRCRRRPDGGASRHPLRSRTRRSARGAEGLDRRRGRA